MYFGLRGQQFYEFRYLFPGRFRQIVPAAIGSDVHLYRHILFYQFVKTVCVKFYRRLNGEHIWLLPHTKGRKAFLGRRGGGYVRIMAIALNRDAECVVFIEQAIEVQCPPWIFGMP